MTKKNLGFSPIPRSKERGNSKKYCPKVRKYIDSQEEHHRIRPFDEEFNDFLERFKRGLG